MYYRSIRAESKYMDVRSVAWSSVKMQSSNPIAISQIPYYNPLCKDNGDHHAD